MINVKDNTVSSRKKMAAVLAWIGLVMIIIIIAVMVYGLMNANGKLALAMIVVLAFVSIIYWIGIKVFKTLIVKEQIIHEAQTRNDMINLANMNTKSLTKGS